MLQSISIWITEPLPCGNFPFCETLYFHFLIDQLLQIEYLRNALPWWLSGKESACQCRGPGFKPWVGKILWRRKWQPTPVCLLGNPMVRETWWATVHGITRVRHDWVSKQQQIWESVETLRIGLLCREMGPLSQKIENTLNTLLESQMQKKCMCGSRRNVCVLSHFSRVWLFVTPWTVAHQAPLSMRFSRQEYWSGLPFPSPGDLPDPGIEPASLTSPTLAGRFFTNCATWESCRRNITTYYTY